MGTYTDFGFSEKSLKSRSSKINLIVSAWLSKKKNTNKPNLQKKIASKCSYSYKLLRRVGMIRGFFLKFSLFSRPKKFFWKIYFFFTLFFVFFKKPKNAILARENKIQNFKDAKYFRGKNSKIRCKML